MYISSRCQHVQIIRIQCSPQYIILPLRQSIRQSQSDEPLNRVYILGTFPLQLWLWFRCCPRPQLLPQDLSGLFLLASIIRITQVNTYWILGYSIDEVDTAF
jgi:hypothetical protein